MWQECGFAWADRGKPSMHVLPKYYYPPGQWVIIVAAQHMQKPRARSESLLIRLVLGCIGNCRCSLGAALSLKRISDCMRYGNSLLQRVLHGLVSYYNSSTSCRNSGAATAAARRVRHGSRDLRRRDRNCVRRSAWLHEDVKLQVGWESSCRMLYKFVCQVLELSVLSRLFWIFFWILPYCGSRDVDRPLAFDIATIGHFLYLWCLCVTAEHYKLGCSTLV